MNVCYTRKLDLFAYVNRRQVRQTPSMLNFVELRILTSPPSIIHIDLAWKKSLYRQRDGAVQAVGGPQLSPTETKPEKKYYSTEYVKLPDRKNITTGTRLYASNKTYKVSPGLRPCFPNAWLAVIHTYVGIRISSQGDFWFLNYLN